MPTFRRHLNLAFSLILLLTSPCAAEPSQEAKYYLFRDSWVPLEALIPYIHSTDPSAPCVHPMLKGGEYENVLMSVQQGDKLKVGAISIYALTDPEGVVIRDIAYFDNPERRSFTGMEADGGLMPCAIRFEDGTTFSVPEDTPADAYYAGQQNMKGGRYVLQWRRVYGNYYFVTFSGEHGPIYEEYLMTEKDGRDLRPLLGDSSAEPHPKFRAGYHEPFLGLGEGYSYLAYTDRHGGRVRFKTRRVEEHELPPDFPKGLVRWLP